MAEIQIVAIIVVGGTLLFEFTNGWNDSANAIATVVSTRVLSPLSALLLAAVLNFAGAFWGQAVAKTIMHGIVNLEVVRGFSVYYSNPELIPLMMTLAAVLAAALWIALATWRGMPISGSHSLVGGLMGSGFAVGGIQCLEFVGIKKVLLGLVLSPLAGILIGFVCMLMLMWIFRKVSAHVVNKIFGKLQIASVSLMAFSHGTNDAQKAMGVVTLALVAGGLHEGKDIPYWVIIMCGTVMAFGTALGGWRVIKTLGLGLMHLKPVHGFAAETAAAAVLMGAASMGAPVSTTHVITSSIVGVGSTYGVKAVQWGIGKKILYAWFITFPATMLFGAGLFKALSYLI